MRRAHEPDQPPLLRHALEHVWLFVAQTLLWHDRSSENVVPSLHVQSNGVHSPPAEQGCPGAFGPPFAAPASPVDPAPVQPPRAAQAEGQIAASGEQLPPEHAPGTTGVVPSLQAQMLAVQSPALEQVQPPWV